MRDEDGSRRFEDSRDFEVSQDYGSTQEMETKANRGC